MFIAIFLNRKIIKKNSKKLIFILYGKKYAQTKIIKVAGVLRNCTNINYHEKNCGIRKSWLKQHGNALSRPKDAPAFSCYHYFESPLFKSSMTFILSKAKTTHKTKVSSDLMTLQYRSVHCRVYFLCKFLGPFRKKLTSGIASDNE